MSSSPEASSAPDETLAELGRRIRSSRERLGLTQEEFARRAAISVSFASLLERGERSPSYETLVQISRALGLSLGELFVAKPSEETDDVPVGRLADFARRARLTKPQIERLIAVATAMFDLPSSAVLPTGPSPTRTCSQARCGRPVLARGLCASHYHRSRRPRR